MSARFVVLFHPGPPQLASMVHSGDPERANWDVFSESSDVTAESLHLYKTNGCSYVRRFLEANPSYHYIGSEDDIHLYPNYPPEEKE